MRKQVICLVCRRHVVANAISVPIRCNLGLIRRRPETRMPKFITFDNIRNRVILRVHKNNLLMSAISICKGGNGHFFVIQNPFAMVERITRRSPDRRNQLAIAIGNQQAFMRAVFGTDKLDSRFATKIKEQRTLGRLVERSIASLFVTIPDNIFGLRLYSRFLCGNTGAEQASARDRQRFIGANTTMISAIEEFGRFAKLAICKLHLPCRRSLESRFILVIAGIRHVHNHGIAIFEHTPARNRRRLHVKLYK